MTLADQDIIEVSPTLLGRAKLPLALFSLSVLIGAILQVMPWTQSSKMGRMDAALPIPLGFIVVVGVGGWIAWSIFKERGKHRIFITHEGVTVIRNDGRYNVLYEEIDGVGTTPDGGVGIELCAFKAWVTTQPELPDEISMIADSALDLEGFDLVFAPRQLNRPAQEVFELISKRMDNSSASSK